jgi:fimbrial isopeptide formation D2 family protein
VFASVPLSEVDGTGVIVPVVELQLPEVAGSSRVHHNAVSIDATGQKLYWVDFSTIFSNDPVMHSYDLVTGDFTSTDLTSAIPSPIGGNMDFTSGAVNPINGYYYFGATFDGLGMYAYNPGTDTVFPVGELPDSPTTASGLATGDYAFSATGNLFYVEEGRLYVISAQDLPSSPSTAVLKSTELVEAGQPPEIRYDGAAFDRAGNLYLSSVDAATATDSMLWKVNPLSGQIISSQEVDFALGDMASCTYPSTLRLDKDVVSRANPDDQFELTVDGGGLSVTATTSDTALGVQGAHAGPVIGVEGTVYTLSETAVGSTDLADYTTTYECRDTTNNNALVTSGRGTSFTVTFPTPVGQEIVCVFTNTARPTVTKSVVDADAVGLGDEVTWTVDAGIPAGTVDGYRVTDQIDAKLTVDPDTGVGVGLSTDAPNTTSLSVSTDGGVTGDYTRTYQNNLLTITFTADGRAKLQNAYTANPGTRVVVSLTSVVNTVGVIQNTALVYPNAFSFTIALGEAGGPVVSDPVVTKWGGVLIQKQDTTGDALEELAQGATFQVYATNPATDLNAVPVEVGGDGNPATTGDGGQSTWTVDPSTGEVTITGLRYSDFANGQPITNPSDWQHYWLVETQAPSGYELLAQPLQFDITAANDALIVATNPVGVADAPHNAGFTIPFTGGPGTIAWAAGASGLAILALIGALMTTPHRRRPTARHCRT